MEKKTSKSLGTPEIENVLFDCTCNIVYALATAEYLAKQKAVSEIPLAESMLGNIITTLKEAEDRLWKTRQEVRKRGY